MPVIQTSGGTMFTGEAVSAFAMITLKHAIKLYASTGVRVNRAYTPTAMKRTAEQWTGRTFKRGAWADMVAALDEAIAAVRARDEEAR